MRKSLEYGLYGLVLGATIALLLTTFDLTISHAGRNPVAGGTASIPQLLLCCGIFTAGGAWLGRNRDRKAVAEASAGRWVSISLRTLFIVIAVFCVSLGYQLNQILARKALVKRIIAAGAEISLATDQSSWRSRYFGDNEVDVIHFHRDFVKAHYNLLEQAKNSFESIVFMEVWGDENVINVKKYGGKNGEFLE